MPRHISTISSVQPALSRGFARPACDLSPGTVNGPARTRFARAVALAWLLVAAVACGGPGSESTPPVSADVTAPALTSSAASSAPAAGVYITNETSGDLSVIDAATATVVATIPLGKRPRGIAASPDRRTLYVALSGSPPAPPGVDEKSLPPPDRSADGIGVVDLDQLKLVKVLPSGTDPEVVAVSHDGTRIFVANEDAAKASVVDVATGTILESFAVGAEPEGVAVQPGAERLWVTSEDDGTVVVIDLPTEKRVGSIPVGPRPRSVAFLPDGSRAYVPSENGATITVIDTSSLKALRTIQLGEGMRPMGTAVAADGSRLYVTTGRSRQLLSIDTKTNAVVGSVEAGPRPWGLAVSADGRTAYTANGPSNDVSIVDLQDLRVTGTVSVGQGPWGAVFVTRASPPSN